MFTFICPTLNPKLIAKWSDIEHILGVELRLADIFHKEGADRLTIQTQDGEFGEGCDVSKALEGVLSTFHLGPTSCMNSR